MARTVGPPERAHRASATPSPCDLFDVVEAPEDVVRQVRQGAEGSSPGSPRLPADALERRPGAASVSSSQKWTGPPAATAAWATAKATVVLPMPPRPSSVTKPAAVAGIEQRGRTRSSRPTSGDGRDGRAERGAWAGPLPPRRATTAAARSWRRIACSSRTSSGEGSMPEPSASRRRTRRQRVERVRLAAGVVQAVASSPTPRSWNGRRAVTSRAALGRRRLAGPHRPSARSSTATIRVSSRRASPRRGREALEAASGSPPHRSIARPRSSTARAASSDRRTARPRRPGARARRRRPGARDRRAGSRRPSAPSRSCRAGACAAARRRPARRCARSPAGRRPRPRR